MTVVVCSSQSGYGITTISKQSPGCGGDKSRGKSDTTSAKSERKGSSMLQELSPSRLKWRKKGGGKSPERFQKNGDDETKKTTDNKKLFGKSPEKFWKNVVTLDPESKRNSSTVENLDNKMKSSSPAKSPDRKDDEIKSDGFRNKDTVSLVETSNRKCGKSPEKNNLKNENLKVETDKAAKSLLRKRSPSKNIENDLKKSALEYEARKFIKTIEQENIRKSPSKTNEQREVRSPIKTNDKSINDTELEESDNRISKALSEEDQFSLSRSLGSQDSKRNLLIDSSNNSSIESNATYFNNNKKTSPCSNGESQQAMPTLISTATSALRRLHFKSGRVTRSTIATSGTGVPKMFVMGSSSQSDATINTSTDSAQTMITSVTNTTDGDLTEDSLDLQHDSLDLLLGAETTKDNRQSTIETELHSYLTKPDVRSNKKNQPKNTETEFYYRKIEKTSPKCTCDDRLRCTCARRIDNLRPGCARRIFPPSVNTNSSSVESCEESVGNESKYGSRQQLLDEQSTVLTENGRVNANRSLSSSRQQLIEDHPTASGTVENVKSNKIMPNIVLTPTQNDSNFFGEQENVFLVDTNSPKTAIYNSENKFVFDTPIVSNCDQKSPKSLNSKVKNGESKFDFEMMSPKSETSKKATSPKFTFELDNSTKDNRRPKGRRQSEQSSSSTSTAESGRGSPKPRLKLQSAPNDSERISPISSIKIQQQQQHRSSTVSISDSGRVSPNPSHQSGRNTPNRPETPQQKRRPSTNSNNSSFLDDEPPRVSYQKRRPSTSFDSNILLSSSKNSMAVAASQKRRPSTSFDSNFQFLDTSSHERKPSQSRRESTDRRRSTDLFSDNTPTKSKQLKQKRQRDRSKSGSSSPRRRPPPLNKTTLPDLRVDFFNNDSDGGSPHRSEKRGSVCLTKCLRDVGAQQCAGINVTSNPLDESPVRRQPQATIVVQQPSLSLDSSSSPTTVLLKNGGDFATSNIDKKREWLDVGPRGGDGSEFDRYGSPHHSRSQSVKTPGRSSSGRPNYLCLPQQRSRVASMPNTGVEEEYYRLRHFSITGKGVVNRGDSLKSRHRSRSNTSVASSTSSTEHLTTAPASASYPGSARTSVSSRESSNASQSAVARLSEVSGPLQGVASYRVQMLGAAGVGKSSLVSQFMTSEYLHAYDTSIDDDSGEKSVSVLLAGEESELVFIDQPYSEITPYEDSVVTANLEVPCTTSTTGDNATASSPSGSTHKGDNAAVGTTISTPHQEHQSRRQSQQQNNAYCVVYSCVDRGSLNEAERILARLWTEGHVASKAVILVANKVDLARSRTVTTDEGKTMATQYDCKFIETSVGINHNVDELLVGLLTQIRLKLENPERTRDLFRRRSCKSRKGRSKSPASLTSALMSSCTGNSDNVEDGSSEKGDTLSSCWSPGGGGKFRGRRLSTSLKVKGLLGKVWARDSKSKSCENLHVL